LGPDSGIQSFALYIYIYIYIWQYLFYRRNALNCFQRSTASPSSRYIFLEEEEEEEDYISFVKRTCVCVLGAFSRFVEGRGVKTRDGGGEKYKREKRKKKKKRPIGHQKRPRSSKGRPPRKREKIKGSPQHS
jgi:hypothetical protein